MPNADSNTIAFVRNHSTGNYSFEIDNVSLKEVRNEYFPVYNGNFWDIFLATDGASGSNATVSFGAYQANYLREVNHYTSSVTITEKQNAESFGNPFFDNGNHIGGVEKGFFGGIKDIISGGKISQSFYSVSWYS